MNLLIEFLGNYAMLRYEAFFLGSTQLTGDGHLSNTVEYTIPTTVCQDAHSVILEISKSIRSPGHHFHFSVEALGDSV